jgi:hypothetical protein
MADKEPANHAAVTIFDIACIYKRIATAVVANRLGVSIDDVQQFLDGNATEGMRNLLGLPTLAETENVGRNDGPSTIVGLLKWRPNRDNP